MKLIHLGIKEKVLCDKDTDSGIKSTNAHYHKDGPDGQRKSGLEKQVREVRVRVTFHATSPQYWNHMCGEACIPSKMGEVDVLWWWSTPLEERP